MKINKNIFKNKKIIVTGGTGSIGSEIVRQLLKFNVAQVRIYSRDEYKQYELINELGKSKRLRFLIGDIRDKERMDMAFNGVDICFHAAALKQVPMCEYNPFEAIKTNILGTQNVIDLAIKHNLEKVIAISTDKAVDPSSVMGASKLMMEKLITAAEYTKGKSNTKFAAVRFGNVLNSRGSVIPLWTEQIKKGGPITVTNPKMTRFFMDTSKAVNLVFKAAELMQGGEIFVLKMDKKNIMDLAKETIQKHAFDKKIPIKIIGIRRGEKLYEKLMTEEELENALETDKMLILTSQVDIFYATTQSNKYPCAKSTKLKEYRSDK